MKLLGDDHDPGDEDRDAARERAWFPVFRPLNSGQHVCPNMAGYRFGPGLDDVFRMRETPLGPHVTVQNVGS